MGRDRGPFTASDRSRFLHEARTVAKLSHPHIISIFTVDEVADFVFFAMAYVDGETLTQRVGRRACYARWPRRSRTRIREASSTAM